MPGNPPLKISIIGHTKSLGKALYGFFNNDHVVGFSRSNGYDIKSPFDRKKIIRESQDSDILINLVHNYYHQTDVLYEFYKNWEDKEKLIINISSAVIDDSDWGIDRLDYLEYKNQKLALESMALLLSKRKAKVQIRNYRISEINFEEDCKNLNSIIDEFRLHKK
mgnify:CR=1 FL=1|tara:strand:+ start:725 stop:1219 length:495 start_codon:yes stop_codon:yes gene_type:complete